MTFASSAFANSGFQTDAVLSAGALAQLYGGGAVHERKKKKPKHEEATLEQMVRVVAAEPEGKEEVIAALPKRVARLFPDPGIVAVSDLVTRVEQGSARVQAEIERLYAEHMEDEDDDMLMLLY